MNVQVASDYRGVFQQVYLRRTVPSNFGVMVCGFIEIFISGTFWLLSGLRAPARRRQNVVSGKLISRALYKCQRYIETHFRSRFRPS